MVPQPSIMPPAPIVQQKASLAEVAAAAVNPPSAEPEIQATPARRMPLADALPVPSLFKRETPSVFQEPGTICPAAACNIRNFQSCALVWHFLHVSTGKLTVCCVARRYGVAGRPDAIHAHAHAGAQQRQRPQLAAAHLFDRLGQGQPRQVRPCRGRRGARARAAEPVQGRAVRHELSAAAAQQQQIVLNSMRGVNVTPG